MLSKIVKVVYECPCGTKHEEVFSQLSNRVTSVVLSPRLCLNCGSTMKGTIHLEDGGKYNVV